MADFSLDARKALWVTRIFFWQTFVHITPQVIENLVFSFLFCCMLLFCFAQEDSRAIRVSDFPRTFEPMVLHVSDISVIANTENNRHFEHTKSWIQRCSFPHIQFLWNYAVLLVASKHISCVKLGWQSYYKDYFSEKVSLNFALMLLWPMKTLLLTAVDKTWIGQDRIESDRTDKTWIGSDRTHKTWIGSNSIKQTHIYSLKVGAFQILIKNWSSGISGSRWRREIKKVIAIALFLLFPSPFCGEDWLFIVMHLNYFIKRSRFSREREIQAERQRGIEPKVTMIVSLPSFTWNFSY